MEKYFTLLDLPPTATAEEIKIHYQLLMRLYHPGRFTSPLDKRYAGYKCAELTSAYLVLTGDEAEVKSAEMGESAFPAIEPTLIDWGTITQGSYLAAQVYIHPQKTAPNNITLTPNANTRWLSVSGPERVKSRGNSLWVFGVMVNTRRLEIGRRYVSQVAVNLDQVSRNVFLLMKIAAPLPYQSVNHRRLDPAELLVDD